MPRMADLSRRSNTPRGGEQNEDFADALRPAHYHCRHTQVSVRLETKLYPCPVSAPVLSSRVFHFCCLLSFRNGPSQPVRIVCQTLGDERNTASACQDACMMVVVKTPASSFTRLKMKKE
ncbi:hypothetical protein VTK73DRAFT_3119 [Phialemonium thermophilum]|uniref:Uncharacterized protein n=1 Tax=Phialemonium thermophilum TaxID=223376 RepID=A0ABR3VLH9_9PEZI